MMSQIINGKNIEYPAFAADYIWLAKCAQVGWRTLRGLDAYTTASEKTKMLIGSKHRALVSAFRAGDWREFVAAAQLDEEITKAFEVLAEAIDQKAAASAASQVHMTCLPCEAVEKTGQSNDKENKKYSRVCNSLITGEECPYGLGKCNFAHSFEELDTNLRACSFGRNCYRYHHKEDAPHRTCCARHPVAEGLETTQHVINRLKLVKELPEKIERPAAPPPRDEHKDERQELIQLLQQFSLASQQATQPRKRARSESDAAPGDLSPVEKFKDNLIIILRGLPGSGKTTLAQRIKQQYPETVICSADDFFTKPDGAYCFDPELLTHAHKACERKYISAIASGLKSSERSIIIVDNTSSRFIEYQNYIHIAGTLGVGKYSTLVAEVSSDARGQLDTASKRMMLLACHTRCQHNVPLEAITAMYERFEADPMAISAEKLADRLSLVAPTEIPSKDEGLAWLEYDCTASVLRGTGAFD